MNIYDISTKTGFSTATISRVINNKGNVSEKTAKKIREAIKESGYTPNVFARALGGNSIKTIGVMCSDASDIYMATAVTILERELRGYGYDAILCNTGYELEDKRKYMSILLDKRVDAIILVGSQFKESNDNTHIAAIAAKIPVMLINAYLDMENVYCTVCSDRAVTREAATRCLRGGHKDIFFCIDKHSYSSDEKLDGYKDALHDAGIPFRQELTAFFPRDILQSQEKMMEVLEVNPNITCLICADDLLAVSAVKAAQAKGLNIPADISVIGFNDSLLSLCTTPSLTSIDNKVNELCKATVKTMINVFEGRDTTKHTVVSSDITERGSTRWERVGANQDE